MLTILQRNRSPLTATLQPVQNWNRISANYIRIFLCIIKGVFQWKSFHLKLTLNRDLDEQEEQLLFSGLSYCKFVFLESEDLTTMRSPIRNSGFARNPSETMRLFMTTSVGIVFGFFLGTSFPTISLSKMSLPSSLFPSIDLTYIKDKYSDLSTHALLNAFSSLKDDKDDSPLHKYHEDTKVHVILAGESSNLL